MIGYFKLLFVACFILVALIACAAKEKQTVRIGLGYGLSKHPQMEEWHELDSNKITTLDGFFAELGGWPKAPYKIGDRKVDDSFGIKLTRNGKKYYLAWIYRNGEIKKMAFPDGGFQNGDIISIAPSG